MGDEPAHFGTPPLPGVACSYLHGSSMPPAQGFSQTGSTAIPGTEQQLEEYYSTKCNSCGFLYRYDYCCKTSHFTCTKCLLPVLIIVAQVLRQLFDSCAYECKCWSLKVVFTNLVTISGFPVLICHQGDVFNATSTPHFKANYKMVLVWSLKYALFKVGSYLREGFFSLNSREHLHWIKLIVPLKVIWPN